MTAPTHPEAQLAGRWLTIARGGWLVVVVLIIGLVFFTLPRQFAYLQEPCEAMACEMFGPLSPDRAREFQDAGLSVRFYAAYALGVRLILALGYLAVSGLIFWRKSHDRMAIFVSFYLATFIAYGITLLGGSAFLSPALEGVFFILSLFGILGFYLFFYIFPNGRFVPRWTPWLFVGVVVYYGAIFLFPDSPWNPFAGDAALNFPGFVILLFSTMAVQIYRYWRVSTMVERQQTKWVVFGIALTVIGILGLILMFSLIPPEDNLVAALAGMSLFALFIFFIPVSIAVAIFRHRLWDIDLVIRRTLQYALLTSLLALTYFGGVVLLQAILGPLTGAANSPLVTVITTLAIAALFFPLRRRVQAFIDRRFYRAKYDAEQALAQFAATAREEVDMDRLASALLSVVEETMRPEKVGLWLRKSNRG